MLEFFENYRKTGDRPDPGSSFFSSPRPRTRTDRHSFIGRPCFPTLWARPAGGTGAALAVASGWHRDGKKKKKLRSRSTCVSVCYLPLLASPCRTRAGRASQSERSKWRITYHNSRGLEGGGANFALKEPSCTSEERGNYGERGGRGTRTDADVHQQRNPPVQRSSRREDMSSRLTCFVRSNGAPLGCPGAVAASGRPK